MYDYLLFCLTTVYSRFIFFIFPSKLERLKNERKELGDAIRTNVEKYIQQVDKEYANNRIIKDGKINDIKQDAKEDVSDNIEYLERRATVRKTKKSLVQELNILALANGSQDSFKYKEINKDDVDENSDSDTDVKTKSTTSENEKSLLDKKNDWLIS